MENVARSDDAFRTRLEFVEADGAIQIFRLAFEACLARYLLTYPCVTGLRFTSRNQNVLHEWQTGYLISAPLDEFVLNPTERIAFDLRANINGASSLPSADQRWAIQLPNDEYDVQYVYSVTPEKTRYDYLNKGSRFADMTPPWTSTVNSNVIKFALLNDGK